MEQEWLNTTKARIDRLTAEAVAFIRRAESLALKMDARGSVTATGIRRAESARRKKRNAVEMNGGSFEINGEELVELDENTFFSTERKETVHCVGNKDKVIINPIYLYR